MRSLRVVPSVSLLLFLVGCSAAPNDNSLASAAAISTNDNGTETVDQPAVGYLTLQVNTAAGNVEWTKSFCTGTLIRPTVVLTAAHCIRGIVTKKKPQLEAAGSVILGVGFGTGLDDGAHVTAVAADQTFEHPQAYASAKDDAEDVFSEHDIAYVVLERAVEGVTVASVATKLVAKSCGYTAIGYGHTSDDPASPKLRRSLPGCVLENGSSADNDHTVGAQITGGGLCNGDSGGPFLKGNTVVGVLSRAFTCETNGGDGDGQYSSVVRNAAFVKQALAAGR